MASSRIKPIVTAQTQPDKSIQFKHFGVLDDGRQSKSSLVTSITFNVVVALIICLIGAAAKKTIDKAKDVNLTYIPTEPPPKPKPQPILKPPPPLPKPPDVKLEPPKIKIPDIKMPEPPKTPEIKLAPVPINLPPAPPKLVKAPAAPQVVNLSKPPQAAAIANNQVASPIRLGTMDNPIKSTGPAVSNVNLGQAGARNMPSSNSGLGAVSKVNLGGNGQPTGGTSGNGLQAVQGVKLGVPGGTGPLDSKGRTAAAVSLAAAPPPPPIQKPPAASGPTAGSAPKVLFKPAPEYTAEARSKHIEGTITVKIKVAANGAVTVLGLSNDLGYGLGNSAMKAVQGTRFQPATDASGHPVEWTGQVNVLFQLAG